MFLIRLKDEDLLEAPDDSTFLQSLRFSCARVGGVYSPLALVEAYITEKDSAPRAERFRGLQEGHSSVTKGTSPSAKHPLKVSFTKT